MIAIINYGMGNLLSVKKAFDVMGIESIITNNKEDIQNSAKLLLPGVGAYGDAVDMLKQKELFDLIKDEVLNKKKPILGICLGMQLLGTTSQESEGYNGFGFIDAECIRFGSNLKVPHVGWNNIHLTHNMSLIFKNIPQNSDFYFVHSYHFTSDIKDCTAYSDYGDKFCCALEKDNIFGVQFHPEKSQQFGLEILKNFGQL